ncbi:hypothetical protein [Hymenobacter terrestris]|uniref:Sulfotransferase domain-containing protein n=1 Tax=Hymenobacter terrestris TaxID=2748310 RepID=A0ABX2Q2S9_9BACT|nr:hypothetical protein [Hymenobacter terrestris]NVO85265.1 hypothetical protein [Hymenobacter terrestris]
MPLFARSMKRHPPYQSLFIDEDLRVTFNRLQSFLGIVFDQEEIEQVFFDAEHDQISFKYYTFYTADSVFFPEWEVTGAVSEYEPETLFLQSSGGFGERKRFEQFFSDRTNT